MEKQLKEHLNKILISNFNSNEPILKNGFEKFLPEIPGIGAKNHGAGYAYHGANYFRLSVNYDIVTLEGKTKDNNNTVQASIIHEYGRWFEIINGCLCNYCKRGGMLF